MGGTVGFTIRTADNREHRMLRWTNTLPAFFHNVRFINGDQRHIDDYLKRWYDMVDAYKMGDTSKVPMADVYVPDAGLYPCEYGLVLVDFPSHTILNMQMYAHLNVIDGSGVSLALMDYERDESHPFYKLTPKDTGNFDRYKALFEERKVSQVRRSYGEEWKPAESITIQEFGQYDRDGRAYLDALLDMSPWNIVNYEDSEGGVIDMMKKVIELGFVLTPYEEKQWNGFTKRNDE